MRRLLTVAAERAFARLTRENGFHDDEFARIALPVGLDGDSTSGATAAPLGTSVVQDRLLRQLNRAAELGALSAAPLLKRAIRDLAVTGASSILRGGGAAATDYLRQTMGESLFEALAPAVGEGLRTADSELLTQALQASDVNFEGLRLEVARRASDSLYRAIGREEAAIRADPSQASRILSGFDWL